MCESRVWGAFSPLPSANTESPRACGTDNSCIAGHLREIAAASQAAENFWDGRTDANGEKIYASISKLFQDRDLAEGIANYRYNAHLQTECPGLDSGCIARYQTTEDAKTALDFVPVVGDVKGFYDAYQSGSLVDWAAAVIGVVPAAGDAIAKAIKLRKLEGLADLSRAEFDALPEVSPKPNATKPTSNMSLTVAMQQLPQIGGPTSFRTFPMWFHITGCRVAVPVRPRAGML